MKVGSLVLSYPASWLLTEPDFVTSFSSIDAYVSTIPVPDPCRPIPNWQECNASAYELAPGSVVVTVGSQYLHGAEEDQLPLTIAGMPAAFEHLDPVPGTLADIRLHWRIAMPGGPFAWHVITADIRGPGLDQMIDRVTRMIDGLRFEPAVEPLPADPDQRAAEAARILAQTLNQLMVDSPAFRCFPRVPGRIVHAVLAELPMGPKLAEGVPVTCASQVEATRYEMWKVILTIEFANPADGDGPVVTEQWVARDGTLGAMTSGVTPPAGEPPP